MPSSARGVSTWDEIFILLAVVMLPWLCVRPQAYLVRYGSSLPKDVLTKLMEARAVKRQVGVWGWPELGTTGA